MPGIKIVVIYPTPKDVAAFEKIYLEEHMPLAGAKLAGVSKFATTKILGTPQGAAPFHRITEIHFPSREALEACISSQGGQETVAHAVRISTGGPPIMMIAEEDTSAFTQRARA
jgi:uncharacterized protein (TIGR02118 family)